ncbi:MAG: hypothetical protein M1831_001557 [Alyxoria varia]|nr:MAG: hypothetical protein M1831_001557 [Alyxoria varia]
MCRPTPFYYVCAGCAKALVDVVLDNRRFELCDDARNELAQSGGDAQKVAFRCRNDGPPIYVHTHEDYDGTLFALCNNCEASTKQKIESGKPVEHEIMDVWNWNRCYAGKYELWCTTTNQNCGAWPANKSREIPELTSNKVERDFSNTKLEVVAEFILQKSRDGKLKKFKVYHNSFANGAKIGQLVGNART